MTSWKCMTVPTCSLLWLARLMEPRSLSSCLVAVTFCIYFSPPITVDQTVASRYSTKVRVCFYCLHALLNIQLDYVMNAKYFCDVTQIFLVSYDLKTFQSKRAVLNGNLYWSAVLLTLLKSFWKYVYVCVQTALGMCFRWITYQKHQCYHNTLAQWALVLRMKLHLFSFGTGLQIQEWDYKILNTDKGQHCYCKSFVTEHVNSQGYLTHFFRLSTSLKTPLFTKPLCVRLGNGSWVK